MTSKSDEIVQQVQHEFQTLLADLTGSESTGVVYLGGEDPRCKSVRGRDQARQVIEERLTAWFAAHTVKEAIDTFSHHGIPINAVNDVPTAAHEPQLHERELLWKSRTPSPDASTSPARTSS